MDGLRTFRTLLVIVILTPAPAVNAQVVNVDLGGLVLAVSDSATAQVFHIVDQLSEWDQYAHKQYVRWSAKALTLNQEDRRLLQQHAELRRARGWGKGFEQAFLVADSIEAAATNAVAAGLLSAAEAATERTILNHFTPTLAPLIEQRRDRIAAFRNQLIADSASLRPLGPEALTFRGSVVHDRRGRSTASASIVRAGGDDHCVSAEGCEQVANRFLALTRE